MTWGSELSSILKVTRLRSI